MESPLNNTDFKHKAKELCEEAWLKSFSSVTKQNLNSEIREKELNDKINLIGEYAKADIGSHFQPLTRSCQNKHYPKPTNFIDNKPSPCRMRRIKNKTLNEVQVRSNGLGRGMVLQGKLEKNCLVNPLCDAEHTNDQSWDPLTLPVSHQLEELLGDVYNEAAMRRSLQEELARSSASSLTELTSSSSLSQEEAATETSSLERAFSSVTLVGASSVTPSRSRRRRGAEEEGARGYSSDSPQKIKWEPQDFL